MQLNDEIVDFRERKKEVGGERSKVFTSFSIRKNLVTYSQLEAMFFCFFFLPEII